MPPFRSRRPSSLQALPLPHPPHPSPVIIPSGQLSPPCSPLPPPPPSACACTSTSRSRSCIHISTRPRARSNAAALHPSHQRPPTSPRKTRRNTAANANTGTSTSGSSIFSSSRRSSVHPTPQDSPRSNIAPPSTSPIPQESLNPTTHYATRSSLPHMSIFNPALNFLSGKLEVELLNDGIVDMVGCANTGTSYSLPGNVIITVPTLPMQLQDRAREIRDLSIVVEGKAEYFDNTGRYTPMRIWRKTIQLATPQRPLRIPHVRSVRHRTELAVTFDITIPGWVPPTHFSIVTETSYGMICTAVIAWVEPPPLLGPSYISQLLNEFIIPCDGPARNTRSAARVTAAIARHSGLGHTLSMVNPQFSSRCQSPYKAFEVRRHRSPKAMSLSDSAEPTLRHYTLKPDGDVPSPVECMVSVPDWIDLNCPDRCLRILVRLKAKITTADMPLEGLIPAPSSADDPMDGSSGARQSFIGPAPQPRTVLRSALKSSQKPEVNEQVDTFTNIVELGMEVEETERFCSSPNPQYAQVFPIPDEQPTCRGAGGYPLLRPRANARYEGGQGKPFRGVRARTCLLADDGSQRNFYFVDDGMPLGDKYCKINVVLPMPNGTSKQKAQLPYADVDSPFYRVKHTLKIRIVCRKPTAGPDEPPQVVILSTPIRFATSTRTVPTAEGRRRFGPPAYIQLFHENGDLRQCDPLPLYTSEPEMPVAPPPAFAESSTTNPSASTSNSSAPIASSSRARPILAPISTSAAASHSSMDIDPPTLDRGTPELDEVTIIDSRNSSPEPESSDSESDGPYSRPPVLSPRSATISISRPRASRSAAPPPPPTPRTPGGRKILRRSFFGANEA